VVASTRGAAWFAAGPFAARARAAIAQSGLFGVSNDEDPDAVVIVDSDLGEALIDLMGRVPTRLYRIGKDGTTGIAFGRGWSSQESDGCWTDGEEARISVSHAAGQLPSSLSIEGNPWMPRDGQQQVVEFAVGHTPSAWSALSFWQEEIASVTVPLQPQDWAGGELLLHVRAQRPGRPSEHGGDDQRLLGFKLRSLSLFT
jgi:hypothetical protein